MIDFRWQPRLMPGGLGNPSPGRLTKAAVVGSATRDTFHGNAKKRKNYAESG